MRKIIVTPAGRKRSLEILFNNLKNLKNEFDEWVLWVNTNNLEDIGYMEELQRDNDFIKLQRSEIDVNGSWSIYDFYKKCAEDSIYIRLDDDIVYIREGSIKDLFEFRANNPDYFLVYGNIVNNGITSHLYQRKGVLYNGFNFGYECMDGNGWNNPKAAELIHRTFLKLYEENRTEDFLLNNWILKDYERCSINVISWIGKEFLKFDGKVGVDEEDWLSCEKPRKERKPNIIFGNSLFVHYSFYTQKEYLDATDILEKYKSISMGFSSKDKISHNFLDKILN